MRNFEKNDKNGFNDYNNSPYSNKPVQGERRNQRRAKQQQRKLWG